MIYEINKIESKNSRSPKPLFDSLGNKNRKSNLNRVKSLAWLEQHLPSMGAKIKRKDMPIVLSPTGILNKLDVLKNKWWLRKAKRLRDENEDNQIKLRQKDGKKRLNIF